MTEPDFGRIVGRDPQGFAGAIRALLDDPPAQTEVRRGAERFTWEANSAALFAHLAGLVAHHFSL